MKHLTWAERFLLGVMLLFAIAAGAENTWLGVLGLAATALSFRVLVTAARPAAPPTPLQQRQREQLRAGRWTP
jgi:hypothetical protein